VSQLGSPQTTTDVVFPGDLHSVIFDGIGSETQYIDYRHQVRKIIVIFPYHYTEVINKSYVWINQIIPVELSIIMEFSSNIFWNSSSQFEPNSSRSCSQVLLNNHGPGGGQLQTMFGQIFPDKKHSTNNNAVWRTILLVRLRLWYSLDNKGIYMLLSFAIALEQWNVRYHATLKIRRRYRLFLQTLLEKYTGIQETLNEIDTKCWILRRMLFDF
jgi:hypothetical protein